LTTCAPPQHLGASIRGDPKVGGAPPHPDHLSSSERRRRTCRRQPPALRTRLPRTLGEPHPGPPYLYTLNLVAVAPWSHRTACSGEVSPSRAAMADELRAPDLPRPNPHLRWTTHATNKLQGQAAVQNGHGNAGLAITGDPPPRDSSPAVTRRRAALISPWAARSGGNGPD
jgi:hypothetical protein